MKIRSSIKNDIFFLQKMLFEAAYWNQLENRPTLEIGLQRDDLKYLLSDWGRSGDIAVIAQEEDGRKIGAAWIRFWTEELHSYGFISKDIPELSIGIVKDKRGKGVGKALMKKVIGEAKKKKISSISLSVEKENYACKFYINLGFFVFLENDSDYVLKYKIK